MHSLEDKVIRIYHSVITKDYVPIKVNEVLLLISNRAVDNPIFTAIHLTKTTMSNELGKITLNETFKEKDALDENIVICVSFSSYTILYLTTINEVASNWGVKCLCFNIQDIFPPSEVLKMQAKVYILPIPDQLLLAMEDFRALVDYQS
ncbi:hypothetical protein ZIOFF_049674 [Zingiber officinale]|uniref:Uncharacterized protein n=1 Tax=Zingiber officinale TaxID=94328 RepID=A0A8J5KLI2_ZINOF|nr:hypothetical protein ZIOFF_049674 [Zingiber officinale]